MIKQAALLGAILLAVAPAAAEPARARPGERDVLGEVLFQFDSAQLTSGGATLDRIAQWAGDHPQARLVLDGHCDPRGTAPYNVGLGVRRAKTIRQALIARGVDPDRVIVVTYGEDAPPRATYRLDRRVTVWGTDAPLYAVIDHSLGEATAVVWNEPVDATALVAPRSGEIVVIR